ncbi:hypothetical protein E4T56_gene18469 [Termitomyces sp. T112]|nr:hypothetical protein E4T56_gene18469 [Termitomyces sp. T112]KAH0579303.1 hypothetical protein H2248_003448 [Termitomyces sp. 'cryptogamus']KNZ78589.1 hypothetical protein J132_11159 [Termitomyces sp. J132]
MYYPFLRSVINGARRFQVDGIPKPIPPEGFFQHTFGRWAKDEASQLRRRYLEFNIDALKAATVKAVDGAKSVTEMTKFHETDFSKVFSLTLDNGQKVMARLPTSMAGPARLVTESQVATSEFARQRLGIPVPRTLAWCADRDQTDVGAEFIIEEAPSGVDLCPQRWSTLSLAEKLGATREVWKIEKKLLDNPMPAYGSIFFREDAESLEKHVEVDQTFVVGPSMDTSFWADERAAMDIERGPWTDPYQFLVAICNREAQWINEYGRFQRLDPRFHQPDSTHDPDAHLEALALFGQAIPYVVPSDEAFLQSTLAHPSGLDGSNIWISESALAAGRIEITAITDWQHAVASPLYLLGGLPAVIDLGDYQKKKQLQTMSNDKKNSHEFNQCAAEYDMLAKTEAFSYYETKTDEELQLYATTARSAVMIWGRSLHILRAKIYDIQRRWSDSEFPDPYYISDEKADMWQAERKEWQEHWNVMRLFFPALSTYHEEGWIHPGQYDAACENFVKMKEYWTANIGYNPELLPFIDLAGKEQKTPVDE